MHIQTNLQIPSSLLDKPSLTDSANALTRKTGPEGRQSSQSDVTHKKNAANNMVSAYLRGNNVRQASEGSTAVSTSRTGRQSRSASISGANVAGLQSRYFDQIMGSNKDVGSLLMKQPTFHSVASHALQKELNATFPRFPQAIDPDKIYVNTYEDDYSKHASSQKGAGERRLTSSKTLTEVLKERISSGQTPTYDIGKMGFYSSPTATAGDDQITAIEVSKFETCLDRVGNGFLNTYQQQLDKFWTTSSTYAALGSKKWLATERGAQLRAEVDLRSIDGTLQPQSKTLINQILGLPSGTDRVALPVDSRPGVYAVSLNGRDGSPDIDFSGAFIITSKNGDTPIGTRTDVGAVVLYTPQKGLEEFDSLEALHQALTERFDDAEQRESLLVNVSKKDIDNARSTDKELDETIPFKYTAISDHIFQNRVQSQLDQQKQDVKYAWELVQNNSKFSASTQNIKPNIAEETVAYAADLSQLLDVSTIMLNRNEKLLEEKQPDWLKSASAEDRRALHNLEQEAENKSDTLLPLLEKIPSLERFTSIKIKEKLKQLYPDADIDPDKTLVHITTVTTIAPDLPSTDEHGLSSSAHFEPRSFIETREISLTKLALENLAPWEFELDIGHTKSVTQSAKFTNSSGKEVTMAHDAITFLITTLDVGQQYTDLLNQRLSPDGTSGGAPALRNAWKIANTAKMKSDAFTAQLNPDAFSTQLVSDRAKKRGSQWIDAVINSPDPNTRPTIEGHSIITSYLSLGGANARGGGGQVINGVVVIGVADRRAVPSVVLYTPDAPDGMPYRELRDGEADFAALLALPEWKQYFTERMATNDQNEIDAIVNGRTDINVGVTFRPTAGNLEDAMYKEWSGFVIAHADYRSTSNAEVDRTATYNKVMLAFDIVETLTDIIPFKKAGSIFRRVLGAVNRNLPGQGRKIPGLIWKIGADTKGILTVGTSSIAPLETRLPSLTGYDVSSPSGYSTQGNGVIDAGGKQYVKIEDKWYGSFSRSGERYIQHPTRTGDHFQVQRGVSGQWEPRPRQGLFGGQQITEKLPTTAERLSALPAKLRSGGEVNDAVIRGNYVDVKNLLAADANQGTFSRLLDIHYGQGAISLHEHQSILSNSNPYSRVEKFLDVLTTKDESAKFPDRLDQATLNDTVAAWAAKKLADLAEPQKRALAALPAKLRLGGEVDDDSIMPNYADVVSLLAADANQGTFSRLLDIHYARGGLSLEDRQSILSNSDPYSRVVTFLSVIERKGENSKFPDRLDQAILNGTEAAWAASTLAALAEPQKRELAALPAKLRLGGKVDEAAMGSNSADMLRLFAADANQGTFSRLLDIYYARRGISLEDRQTILSSSNPYSRADAFLSVIEKTGENAKFPDRLDQAILNIY